MLKKIVLVKERLPLPKKRMCYQRSPEARKIRATAFKLLNECEVGQHVQFYGIDRSRVIGFLQSKRVGAAKFHMILIEDNVFGAWRYK